MKTNLFLLISLAAIIVWACSCQSDKKGMRNAGNLLVQEADGTLTLPLENAACYSNPEDPSYNTAEWSVNISTAGRYSIWLSSATTDTTDFSFARTVKVSLQDNQIELKPEGKKQIIRNSSEVNHPFYRADLQIGTFFFQEPGDYYIQVISDKIIAKGQGPGNSQTPDKTRLLSLYLSPVTR